MTSTLAKSLPILILAALAALPFDPVSPPRQLGAMGEEDTVAGILEVAFRGGPSEEGQAISIQLQRLEVFGVGTGWLQAIDSVLDFPLWELEAGLIHTLRPVELAPGRYDRLRLTVEEVQFAVHGRPQEIRIPAGKHVVVQIPGGFEILPDQVTKVSLDLDVARSFPAPARGNHGWGFRPWFDALSVVEEPMRKVDVVTLAALQRLEASSGEPMDFRLGNAFGSVEFLAGDWATDAVRADPADRAIGFVEANAALWRLDTASDAVTATSVWESRPALSNRLTNARLQQAYRGLPVFGADLVVHLRGDRVAFLNGTLVPGIDVPVVPRIPAGDAVSAVNRHLSDQFRSIDSLTIDSPALRVLHTGILDRFADGEPYLSWFVTARTLGPPGHWYYFVDATTGEVIAYWNLVQGAHPSRVYDANNTATTVDDLLWYQDHQKLPGGNPLQEVAFLNTYGDIYYDYMMGNFQLDSIDDQGKRLVARARDPVASTLNACWDCRDDEAIFLPLWGTLDVVVHEYTHGLVEKMAGGLTTGVQARTLNEAHADIFAEYVDCATPGPQQCNWRVGRDTFGFDVPVGPIRRLDNPTIDHWSSYNFGATDPYTNMGIPSKVAYLIAAGGVHNGIGIFPLGLDRAEQIVLATLIDSGLSSSATFEELRDVMVQTTRNMIGDFGITDGLFHQVVQAWCSVGFCAVTQPLAGGVNEDSDYFGWSLAAGNFNGDAYDDLAVGAPYEGYNGKSDTGVVFVFYGSGEGLMSFNSEIIAQSHMSGADETGDNFGRSLIAGNFNGDAYDDLAIGTPGENFDGVLDVGQVSVAYGSSQGLKRTNGSVVWQRFYNTTIGAANETGDQFGWALAAGNFNSDAYDDLAVGSPYEDIGSRKDAGFVAVLFGGAGGLKTNAERITQTQVGAANEAGDLFGYSLAAGNFDGDAYDDLAMGAPGEAVGSVWNAGLVDILHGSGVGLLPASKILRLDQNTIGQTNESGDRFGWALAAGDFDNDAYDDLAVGVPYENNGGTVDTGALNILYGSGSGLFPVQAELLFQNHLGSSLTEKGDQWGFQLAVGRFGGDGFDDLAVGTPYEDFQATNNGLVNVMFGSNAGLFPVSFQGIIQSTVGGQEKSYDYFGWALAAGDFDGDGRDEFAASAPHEDFSDGAVNAGAVYVREY